MDADSIIGDITAVTKKWTRQRKAEERRAGAVRRRAHVYTHRDTAKSAAAEVMEEAYLKASGNGQYPAHARQIMYAARDHIQGVTGEPLDDKYFTQTLLPDYLNDNPTKAAAWDVVFDARGHFLEPHTRREVPLGTLEVRSYLGGSRRDAPVRVRGLFPTRGPENRFGAALFIEKEGFLPLFRRVRLAERYDIAIMSTKGMSVVAARMLVDSLCGGEQGIPLLVLHDLDKSGFSILGSLRRDNRRYTFRNHVEVIDLGLRLADVEANGLDPEGCYIRDTPKARTNLRRNGATPEEIDFLLAGQRVELNAFTSPAFVRFVEGGLHKHDVKKVVPDADVLAQAFGRAFVREHIRAAIPRLTEEAERRLRDESAPDDLARRVAALLGKQEWRGEPWDRIVARLARKAAKEGDGRPEDSAR